MFHIEKSHISLLAVMMKEIVEQQRPRRQILSKTHTDRVEPAKVLANVFNDRAWSRKGLSTATYLSPRSRMQRAMRE